ncbi:hypothetical protein Dthio_PD2214 [Desulfonatronospira thiodismutans ASO3-1]|uniref:Uncharacterized protein n=1 Tax=Desulfonatronospira thiodismutans ASO3-1 TaxID=555779 RepID=D6SQ00_9BACT|nr:hypothetical protein [Desulfonatronospira thiodismutans]EFI34826.1 hypothetical protein Dthio_PD2214 [Desulfonatronospira thiodismutans ASO3-1]
MKIGSLEIDSRYLIIAGVILLLVVIFGVRQHANRQAQEVADGIISEVSDYVKVEYNSVRGEILGSAIVLNGVTVAPKSDPEQKSEIDRVQIQARDFSDNGVPYTMNASIEGLAIYIDDMKPDDARTMRDLGYEEVMRGNLQFGYKYDLDESHLSLHDIGIGIDDMGSISFDLDLGNITPDKRDLMNLLFTHQEILVGDFRLHYNDDSFIPRIIQYVADDTGMSEDEVLEMVIAKVEQDIRVADTNFARESLKNLKSFLENQDSLSITARPEEPRPLGRLMQIQNTDDIIEYMNISIEN